MADQNGWGESRYDERYDDRRRRLEVRSDQYSEGAYSRQDRYRDGERYSGDNRSDRNEGRSFDQNFRYSGGHDPYRSSGGDYVQEANREARYGYGRGDTTAYRPGDNRSAADSMIHRPPYGQTGYGASDWYRSDYTSGRDDYGRSDYRGYGAGDRTAWDKTRDEVSSWFGDNEAARRRELDRERDGRTEYHAGKGPKGYSRSDDRIKEDVSDRLTEDWLLDASEIEVAVSGGEVTLNGTVTGRSDKRRAEDVADRVSGVKHVQNNLRIRDSAQAQAFGHPTADGDVGRTKTAN